MSHSSGSVGPCLECPQDLAVLEELCCRVTQLWVSGAASGLSTGPGCAGGGVLPCHTALGQWGRVWTVHRTWLCWRRCVAVSHSSGSVGPCLDCPQDLAVLEEVCCRVTQLWVSGAVSGLSTGPGCAGGGVTDGTGDHQLVSDGPAAAQPQPGLHAALQAQRV